MWLAGKSFFDTSSVLLSLNYNTYVLFCSHVQVRKHTGILKRYLDSLPHGGSQELTE